MVVVAMVIFRAPDIASAGNVLKGMTGLQGLGLPGRLADIVGQPAMALLDGNVDPRVFATAAAYMLALLAIALLMPNSVQILSAYEPVLNMPQTAPAAWGGFRRPLRWRPTPAWMALFVAIAAISMIRLTGKSEFLYWQF